MISTEGWKELVIYYESNDIVETYYKILRKSIFSFISQVEPIVYYFTNYGDESGKYIRLRFLSPQDLDFRETMDQYLVEEVTGVDLKEYNPATDVGRRYCKRDKDSEVDLQALDHFIRYWYNSSAYFLEMISNSDVFPEFPEIGEAPHLFQNLIGTFVPFPKSKPLSSENPSFNGSWYYVETTSKVHVFNNGDTTFPEVILGSFPNWRLIPPNEFGHFMKSRRQ